LVDRSADIVNVSEEFSITYVVYEAKFPLRESGVPVGELLPLA